MTPEEVLEHPWVRALRPVGPPHLARLSEHSSLEVWHVSVRFRQWPIPRHLNERWESDKKVDSTETWRKRPLLVGEDSGCQYSCGEVEIAARLRNADFRAYWISEWSGFSYSPVWTDYCVKRSDLRMRQQGLWNHDDQLRQRAATRAFALGKSGGHPDVAAWTDESDDLVFIEYKGPGDTIKEKQNLWAQLVLESNAERLCYVAVRGIVSR